MFKLIDPNHINTAMDGLQGEQGIGQFESRYATTKNIEEIKDNQRRNRDTQLQTRVPGRIPERRKTIIRIKSSTRKSLG